MAFCMNCGHQLADGARFCAGCGTAIGKVNAGQERQQEFVGKILKCSNCGAIITETTAVCPDCGIPITNRDAVNSVQRFNDQLMELEKSREQKRSSIMFAHLRKIDSVDHQKLLLIRNFPIPNSIDDISEFVMLAIANIDVTLSKKTFTNALYRTQNTNGETAATIERTISDAWVSKMEQCYRKAEVSFPHHPTFAVVQRAYLAKMKELERKGIGGTMKDMLKF